MTDETQFFRKIYLSHFIQNGTKGLRKGYVWEVSWRLNKYCNILTTSSPGLFNRGPWWPSSRSGAGSHAGILSPKLWLQLTRTSCGTGLYNCLTSTCFLWTSHLHPTQPVYSQGYLLISSTGFTYYLHRCISYLTARPARWSICYKCIFMVKIIVHVFYCKIILMHFIAK